MATARKTTQPKQRAALQADTPFSSASVAAAEAEKVKVKVPKAFRLTRDDGVLVEYPAGVYEMPETDAEHWWSKANGVTPA